MLGCSWHLPAFRDTLSLRGAAVVSDSSTTRARVATPLEFDSGGFDRAMGNRADDRMEQPSSIPRGTEGNGPMDCMAVVLTLSVDGNDATGTAGHDRTNERCPLTSRCKYMASFLTPLLKTPDVPHALLNERTGQVIASNPKAAADSASRRTGLLKHESMPNGFALIIAPCNAVHTFGMRFTIDLIFVDRRGRVLKTCHAVPRRRIAISWRAFATIELAAGTLEQTPVQTGDMVALVPTS